MGSSLNSPAVSSSHEIRLEKDMGNSTCNESHSSTITVSAQGASVDNESQRESLIAPTHEDSHTLLSNSLSSEPPTSANTAAHDPTLAQPLVTEETHVQSGKAGMANQDERMGQCVTSNSGSSAATADVKNPDCPLAPQLRPDSSNDNAPLHEGGELVTPKREELLEKSVSELKHMLRERGLSLDGIVEK